MSEKQELARREIPAILPPIDITEDASGITLLADLPGVPKERLTVRVDGDGLLIDGEAQLDTPEGMQAAYTELQVPHYRRLFTLSRDLDTARAEASFTDGVLRLSIPKVEHAKPRRIDIRVG
jgi:HSP20 family molecular chaperone IbpA